MTDPFLWMALGALLVIGGALWLRERQRRFVDELRQRGDPLAEQTSTKRFRQAFQAHLFGLDGGPGPGRAARTLLTLLMLAILAVIAGYSLFTLVTGAAE
jgi:hypothetical protein